MKATSSTQPRPPVPAFTGPHLDLAAGRDALHANFPDASFSVRHNLVDHPLLQMEALLELAQRLPPKHVQNTLGTVGVNEHGHAPHNGLTVEQTIQQIRECKSWVALDNVEVDPPYRELLHACLEEVKAEVGHVVGPMSQYESFIFITSPGSLTPMHMDPEHNFLLQIHGTKLLHLWDASDRRVVTEEMLEEMHTTDDWARMEVSDRGVAPTWTWELTPGIGAYFPLEAPHWLAERR